MQPGFLKNLVLCVVAGGAVCGLAGLAVRCCGQEVAGATSAAEGSVGVTVPAKNGVELEATINGQGPFDAIFDTGSGNLMTASLAKRLGLKPEGAATMIAGGGDVPAQTVKVDKVNIGGLTMTDQIFTVISVPFDEKKEGIFVGLLLVQNLPIRVDFEKQEITFYAQQSFHYSGDGTVVPIHYQEYFLVADGSVDGMAGEFGIDTGDMFSLSLYAPIVSQLDLVRHYGATIHGYTGEGFGGADRGYYTRAGKLQLGQATVTRPVTVLSKDSSGAEASRTIAGNIGLGVLKQFTVVFDYPHGKMYLEKNSRYGKPDIFNRAGLMLDLDPENLTIKTVIPGGPGEKAGLREDDVITQIDGAPPTDETMVSAFTQPVGTVVRLTVRHAKETRAVSIVLKEVL
jgi:hypothetical protein